MTNSASTPSGWLPLDEALSRALAAVTPVTETENVAVSDALHRITGEDIVSQTDVPPADNSAMDGYALYAADTAGEPVTVSGTQFAGMALPEEKIHRGTAVRIMTGALIPPGAECVVMQENTRREDDIITVTKPAIAGENIRRAGGDIAKGAQVIKRGTRLEPGHLVLLASMGISSVCVFRKLKVGIMATGDELVEAGVPLQSGQIYESNRTGTRALLAHEPVTITDYGIIPDDKAALESVFKEASESQDVIISSGGVSVGDADFVKELVARHGEIAFWKIAIKPGKPFAFGSLGNALFCGVPGNPVSAWVTTQQLVLPMLKRLSGIETVGAGKPLTINATLTAGIKRKAGRQEFLRAVMVVQEDGSYNVTPSGKQSSGVMTTVTQANCYIIVPSDCKMLSAGDTVKVQPFSVNGA